MENIHIQEVKTRQDWRAFIHLPWKIYAQTPQWVPPLKISQRQLFNLKKHPFWQNRKAAFYVAKKEGKTVGRIAAFLVEEYEQKFGDKTGFFGFFESTQESEVGAALFKKAEDFLKGNGCLQLMGPVNPSIHYESGILIEGFEHAPYLMMPYTAIWYPAMLEDNGFTKARDFLAYRVDKQNLNIPDRMRRIQGYLLRKGNLKIRGGNLKAFGKEIQAIRKIYNDAFEGHWGFFPLNEMEFEALGEDMKQIVDPDLVLMAEKDQKPIGFLLCLPNYNEAFSKIRDGRLLPWGICKLLYYRRKIKSARVILIGVKQTFKHLGLGSLFYLEIVNRLAQKGYQEAEISWVIEDNHNMRSAAEMLGAEKYKVYRLFQKKL